MGPPVVLTSTSWGSGNSSSGPQGMEGEERRRDGDFSVLPTLRSRGPSAPQVSSCDHGHWAVVSDGSGPLSSMVFHWRPVFLCLHYREHCGPPRAGFQSTRVKPMALESPHLSIALARPLGQPWKGCIPPRNSDPQACASGVPEIPLPPSLCQGPSRVSPLPYHLPATMRVGREGGHLFHCIGTVSHSRSDSLVGFRSPLRERGATVPSDVPGFLTTVQLQILGFIGS